MPQKIDSGFFTKSVELFLLYGGKGTVIHLFVSPEFYQDINNFLKLFRLNSKQCISTPNLPVLPEYQSDFFIYSYGGFKFYIIKKQENANY